LDIASSPYAVVVPNGLCTTLSTLRDRLGGALALISGRALSSIDSLFRPLRLPAAGQHGAEIRFASGDVARVWVSPGSLHALRQEIDRVVADLPGIVVERKSMGIAVHYRQVPEVSGELARRLADVLARQRRGFHMMCGKFVFEVKPSDAEDIIPVCTLWYIDGLAAIGRREEGREIFEHLLSCRNHLGLLSEDIDPDTGELWGNFPQTYSMVCLIVSAMRLSKSWEEAFWRS
jgi:trehalose phosphatase